MTIKKSLLAVATASTVAIAGAGVANADTKVTDTQLSAEGSLDNFNLDEQLGNAFGSVDDNGDAQLGLAFGALGAIVTAGAAVTGSIMLLPSLDGAIKDFQSWASQYIPQ